MAPVDQRAQRLLTGKGSPIAAVQQAKAVIQSRGNLFNRHRACTCRGEFNGQWNAVETTADVGDRSHRAFG